MKERIGIILRFHSQMQNESSLRGGTEQFVELLGSFLDLVVQRNSDKPTARYLAQNNGSSVSVLRV